MHLTPFFFCLHKLLHLFATYCTFLPLFNPISWLFRGCKSYEIWPSSVAGPSKQGVWVFSWFDVPNFFACMLTKTFILRCKSVCDIKPGIDPWVTFGEDRLYQYYEATLPEHKPRWSTGLIIEISRLMESKVKTTFRSQAFDSFKIIFSGTIKKTS